MQARPVADASAGPAWTMQKAGIGRCVFTAVPNNTSGAVIFENMSTRACRPTRGMPKLNDSLQLQAEFDPRCCLPEIGAILRSSVCRWNRHQPSRTPQMTASSVIGFGPSQCGACEIPQFYCQHAARFRCLFFKLPMNASSDEGWNLRTASLPHGSFVLYEFPPARRTKRVGPWPDNCSSRHRPSILSSQFRHVELNWDWDLD